VAAGGVKPASGLTHQANSSGKDRPRPVRSPMTASRHLRHHRHPTPTPKHEHAPPTAPLL